jgi:RNA-binding protein 5/10
MTFVKEHYPKLSFDLLHSTDEAPDGRVEAYLHYARNRDGREDGDSKPTAANWTCASVSYVLFVGRDIFLLMMGAV